MTTGALPALTVNEIDVVCVSEPDVPVTCHRRSSLRGRCAGREGQQAGGAGRIRSEPSRHAAWQTRGVQVDTAIEAVHRNTVMVLVLFAPCATLT